MRGYFQIGIWEPSKPANVGALLRSAHAMGAAGTFQVRGVNGCRAETNTTKAQRHVPHSVLDDVVVPEGAKLVAVETGGDDIRDFAHPLQAVYLLGNEAKGIPADVLEVCDYVVSIPSVFCLNVAVAGAIVMYDRRAKAIVGPR